MIYRPKNSNSSAASTSSSSEETKSDKVPDISDSDSKINHIDKEFESCCNDNGLIPIPKKAKLKENYRVVIPRSVKEIGIKNRNHTNEDLAHFKVIIDKVLA